MVSVASIRFKNAGKIYNFDPGVLDIKDGDHVIVETARGLEYGTVVGEIKEITEEDIVAPLKEIIRKATKDDEILHEENVSKKEKAIELCQEKVDKHGLDMKLIDVEYTFDSSKIIFYFTSDGRVDFRELVKDLAAVFRMRIELRQIGVRDEAKMIGGIGICGRPLCCNKWLPEFQPVSIKMAKVQNLSLNPTKISGTCGRLMCCLKYENDTYNHMNKGMPVTGEKVKTPDGDAVVIETNLLLGTVKTRLFMEKGKDGEEKLSPDFYSYKKSEIIRTDGGKSGGVKEADILSEIEKQEDIDEEQFKEIQQLLKD